MNYFFLFMIIFSSFLLFILWTMLVAASKADENIEEYQHKQ